MGAEEDDAVLIARATAQLRCYVPEPVDETWGRLRHLGTRREQLITEAGSQIQQMRDLADCACPAALDTAQQPFRSQTWIAALTVIVDRDGDDLARDAPRHAYLAERSLIHELCPGNRHLEELEIVDHDVVTRAEPDRACRDAQPV